MFAVIQFGCSVFFCLCFVIPGFAASLGEYLVAVVFAWSGFSWTEGDCFEALWVCGGGKVMVLLVSFGRIFSRVVFVPLDPLLLMAEQALLDGGCASCLMVFPWV